ncbi:MAG: hypothetical protein R6X16_16515 [Anaerolineae bacterium]
MDDGRCGVPGAAQTGRRALGSAALRVLVSASVGGTVTMGRVRIAMRAPKT